MNAPGEGTVYFDAKKNVWFAKVPIGKNQRGNTSYRKRSAPNRREAEKTRRRLIAERESSDKVVSPIVKMSNFQEFALAHLGGEARNEVREITLRGYLYLLEKYVFPEFGAKKLDELNSQEISAFLVRLRTKVSASQTNHVRAAMSRIFQSALSHQLISDNPIRRTKRMRRKEDDKTTCQEPWSLDECKKAMDVAAGTEMDLFIHLAILTGARLGEMLGLKWKDINFEERTLTIRRTLVELRGARGEGGVRGSPSFGPPKTPKSVRTLTFGKQLHDAFLRHQTAQEALRANAGDTWAETDCVFTTASGSSVWPSNFSAKFRKFLKDNGLRHQNPHAIRHAFACNSLTLGIDLPSISRGLGHTSLDITFSIYAAELTDLQNRATEGLAAWFESSADN